MAKPTPRTPRAALPDAPALQPAPDNGVPYVERQAPAEPAAETPARPRAAKQSVRTYPQLGTRVPPELYERIQRCCAETGVTQAFLVQRGLERELESRGY